MTLKAPVATRQHTFSGVLKSARTTDLSFRVHGMLQELVVTEGTRVNKGDLLARLDPHDFQVSVSQGQAQLAEARAGAAVEMASQGLQKAPGWPTASCAPPLTG